VKLRVRYSSQLRTAMGRDEDELELPAGSSLEMLLMALAERNSQAAAHLVAGGRPRASLLVVINDRAIPARQAAATVLAEGDVVDLLPPIAGG
jgi:molybdopterin synthase sulfur carrier subunit